MVSFAWRHVALCVAIILVAGLSGCKDDASPDPATGGSSSAEVTSQTARSVPEPDEPPIPDPFGVGSPEPDEPPIPDPFGVGSPAPDEPPIPDQFGVGSPAPALSIAQWAHGEPFDGFEPGRVYVVEFWATWCSPCLASMPHVSQLQEEYGDAVTFVGVSNEPEAAVRGFLRSEQSPSKTWTEVLKYRIAVDAGNATTKAYMEAAGQDGIPTAFIVGKNAKVEWIGHPMGMDGPLAEIVADQWDLRAAIEAVEKERRMQQIAEDLISDIQGARWDDALAKLDRAEEELGKSLEFGQIRLSILLTAGRNAEAATAMSEIVDMAWDDPNILNKIARDMATNRVPGGLDLALKAATRASELTDNKAADVLDTLARVHYELGHLDEAIEWQKKAVEHGDGNPGIEATLKEYEAEKAEPADGADEAAEPEPVDIDEP